jgi:hypothetical protein
LYSSSNIIRMMRLRRMEWIGHVECMRIEEECTWVVGGEARKKEPLER